MFKKESADEILSILGEGVEFQGELSFTHGIRIDGTVQGKIRSDASLIVGPKGKVSADIAIRSVSINGELRGTVHASERVEIHKMGKVFGDLYTPCLIIEAGAVFEGKCNMIDQSTDPMLRNNAGEPPAAAMTGSEDRG
jgi:cytoskeletal protein CcmA (bactofilin family)